MKWFRKLILRLFRVREQFPLREQWRLTARNRCTGEVIVKKGLNLIVSVGKYFVGDMLIDKAGYDTGLTYQAIGTSDAAVNVADIILTAEVERKAITFKSRVANVITLSTFFTAGESTFNIKEAGIFGHLATAVHGTPTLFSHWLVAFDNSLGTFDLTFDYILTIG